MLDKVLGFGQIANLLNREGRQPLSVSEATHLIVGVRNEGRVACRPKSDLLPDRGERDDK